MNLVSQGATMGLVTNLFVKKKIFPVSDVLNRTIFSVGNRIQWPGQGLGHIMDVREIEGVHQFIVELDSGIKCSVPIENADQTLWPLLSKSEAQIIKNLLLKPVESNSIQFEFTGDQFMKVVTEGSMYDYANFTRNLLTTEPSSIAELRKFGIFEENVFAPVCEVLDEDPKALIIQVKSIQQKLN